MFVDQELKNKKTAKRMGATPVALHTPNWEELALIWGNCGSNGSDYCRLGGVLGIAFCFMFSQSLIVPDVSHPLIQWVLEWDEANTRYRHRRRKPDRSGDFIFLGVGFCYTREPMVFLVACHGFHYYCSMLRWPWITVSSFKVFAWHNLVELEVT